MTARVLLYAAGAVMAVWLAATAIPNIAHPFAAVTSALRAAGGR